MIASVRARIAAVPRRELLLLAIAIAIGVALRVLAVYLDRKHGIGHGDQHEYDAEGRFIASGHWFWTTSPFGIAHPSAWKAPGYPAWVGVWYSILGAHHTRVEYVQALLVSPLTIVLTWLIARRLLGARAATIAAFVVAVYPLAWQFDVLLFSESIATPLTLLAFHLILERDPTPRHVALVGVLIGVALLVRPSSLFLLAAAAVAWVATAGIRRGVALTALTLACTVLVVLPWTLRNHHVLGGWLPISLQDAAAYGTFNDDSANDPVHPWAWRPITTRDLDLVHPAHPLSDIAFHDELQKRARRYVSDHPSSVLKAFFWNGLSRLWDVRRPARALEEVAPEGRSRVLTKIGLAMYYVLFVLALAGLWRLRRRRGLVLPVLAAALAASVIFTTDSGTRYRAPLEPLIVVLACAAVVGPRAQRNGAEAIA